MSDLVRAFLIALFLVLSSASFAESLDINTATAEQLEETLSGVGKVKAQAIVQDREKNGKFKSIDDLTRVKGIGRAIVEKNRGKLTVGAEAPAEPAAPSSPPQAQSAAPGKPH